jgi:hypothetical protein
MTEIGAKVNAIGDEVDPTMSPEYQSLCPLAALALILGLLSPAALAAPLLLVIPAAAIGVGALALAKIRASDGALTGVIVARWGIALAVACALAPLVRDPLRNALMERQTTEVARQWLTMLAEGRVEDCRALLSGQAIGSLAPHADKPGAEPPAPEVVATIVLDKLRNETLSQRLAGFKTPLIVEADPANDASPVFDGARTMTTGIYTVRPAGDGESCRVQLNFVRAAFYENEGRPWRIERWSLLPAAGADGARPS